MFCNAFYGDLYVLLSNNYSFYFQTFYCVFGRINLFSVRIMILLIRLHICFWNKLEFESFKYETHANKRSVNKNELISYFR